MKTRVWEGQETPEAGRVRVPMPQTMVEAGFQRWPAASMGSPPALPSSSLGISLTLGHEMFTNPTDSRERT